MPYVQVPKDLTKVKTKVAMNLTKRQIICFALAGAVGVPVYFLSKSIVGNDIAMMLLIIIALPFFLFAMYERDGQPLEKILINYIRWNKSPKVRIYRTQNLYAVMSKNDKEVSYIAKKTKNDPQNREKEKVPPQQKDRSQSKNQNQRCSMIPLSRHSRQYGIKTSIRTVSVRSTTHITPKQCSFTI